MQFLAMPAVSILRYANLCLVILVYGHVSIHHGKIPKICGFGVTRVMSAETRSTFYRSEAHNSDPGVIFWCLTDIEKAISVHIYFLLRCVAQWSCFPWCFGFCQFSSR